MKKHSTFSFILHPSSLILLLAIASTVGCTKKEDMTPVQPGEMVTYTDLGLHFSFKAPKSWMAESTPGVRTTYYSTPSTETRFQNLNSNEGDLGARVEVGAKEHSTKEKEAAAFQQSYGGVTFTGPTPDTLGGLPAIRLDYTVTGDPNGLTGYRIFTDKDSLVTYFDAATFGVARMAKFAPIFDLSKASVHPGFAMKITNGKYDSASMSAMMQQMEPSSTFSTYNGSGFSIQYPDNFAASGISGGGVEIKGQRADAMVRVDANSVQKGITLDKYVAENAEKTYHGATPTNATIGGQSAKMVSYGSSGATARAYFVMSGQTIYRITVSWPNSLESAFRPALEKSVQSFKVK
ncbi:MAG: hypothetical protein ACHQNE_04680 [Candidatus Kapaibacterium sp.]